MQSQHLCVQMIIHYMNTFHGIPSHSNKDKLECNVVVSRGLYIILYLMNFHLLTLMCVLCFYVNIMYGGNNGLAYKYLYQNSTQMTNYALNKLIYHQIYGLSKNHKVWLNAVHPLFNPTLLPSVKTSTMGEQRCV